MSDESSHRPDGWPAPEPGQVEVLLLGLYHMDNPGLDEVNVQADDVLAPDRQAELRELVDRLEPWAPDRVAVERPYDRAEELNRVYREYRSGERAYDREESFESVHLERNGAVTECRSEVVQVGFRLADRLDHDRVYPVDDPTDLHNEDAGTLEERGFEPERKVPEHVPRLDFEAREREESERLADSTIPEYLRWVNREEELRYNHRGMFGEYVRWGEGDNFGGPRALGTWFERNLKMVHNVWRAIEGDERVLFVVGSGHVRVLRYLFDETPMFCPVSPLPLLEPE